MKRYERSVIYAAVILGCVVVLPIVIFMMISLWPDRVLVSWLLLGLGALFVFVSLALRVIRTGTIAKVRLDEEKLRTGRLYAHERLIEHEGSSRGEWDVQKQRVVLDEPYTQRPYEYDPRRQVPVPDETNHESYGGLRSLSTDSYDWDEKH
ncbi:MAG TPA: hypothetical protein VED37_01735 [Ktedonobacteraceae bacterium]|nr:hypothetical protein [Ktedonobacteraceae bacterium]